MIPPSRALKGKKGDHQSRIELLAELLKAVDEDAYIIRHGRDRATVFVVCVEHTPELEEAIKSAAGKAPRILKFGKRSLVPLQVDKTMGVGQIADTLYDPADGRWTSTIAVYRYR